MTHDVEHIERLNALEKQLKAFGRGDSTALLLPSASQEASFASIRLEIVALLDEMGAPGRAILRALEREKGLSHLSEHSVSLLLGAVASARSRLIAPILRGAKASRQRSRTAAKPDQPTSEKSVFLVHGHDTAAQQMVARFLEKLQLEPIILSEKPAKGQTIIEKLEAHSRVAFAVVLLTPDDEGGKVGAEERRPRARQNVILELGYFLGSAGRTRVAALYDISVELPSDYRGVEYIELDAGAGWKLKLARELHAAGLPVDMNRAL